MAYEVYNRAALRQMALVYCRGSDTQNPWGNTMNQWLNEGVRRLWSGTEGVGDYLEIGITTGDQTIPVVPGFLRPREVLLTDALASFADTLEFRRLTDVDLSSSGYSRPAWYSIFFKPAIRLLLGPQAADQPYIIKIFYYRTPNAMMDDSQLPDVPQQFITAPAKFAAAMAALSERDFQTYQALMQEFQTDHHELRDWTLDESRDNFYTVNYVYEC
jgi:hypothetical protein